MSSSIAYKHYIRALSRWPKDNLRPDCQLQDVLRKRIDRKVLPASTSKTANSAVDEKSEMEQSNVLYSLLENRYTKQYPITGSLMTPQSNPNHYKDLVKEMAEAPERSLWGRLTNRWKGALRFQ